MEKRIKTRKTKKQAAEKQLTSSRRERTEERKRQEMQSNTTTSERMVCGPSTSSRKGRRFVKLAVLEKKQRLQEQWRRDMAAAQALNDSRMVANAFRAWRVRHSAAKAKTAQEGDVLKAAQLKIEAERAQVAAVAVQKRY